MYTGEPVSPRDERPSGPDLPPAALARPHREPSVVWAGLRALCVSLVLACAAVAPAGAQAVRGVVVDQTGLPLPGVTVQLLDGDAVVGTWITAADGSFDIEVALQGSTVVASLDGFETTRIERVDATEIVLPVGRAAESTSVVADVMVPSSPTSALIGTSLPATMLQRIPPSRMRTREALPLLPAVVRGPDGLLVGGARPHETPLFIDLFDVTDPATGSASINLAFETTRGVEVLRDPMAITYGGLMGGLVQLDTRTGDDKRSFGVQGFVPRPRLATPGFGRLEGIFPRIYYGDSVANGRVRFFSAAEYNFERIPVPLVTRQTGPDIVEQSGSFFGRLDVEASPRTGVTVEGFIFPAATDSSGLSPRRTEQATATLRAKDAFAGITSRHIIGTRNVLTLRLGVLSHDARLRPRGTGESILSPAGWRDNWFSAIHRRATRYAFTAAFERTVGTGRQTHELTLQARLADRRLVGDVSNGGVRVEDAQGRAVRAVSFGAPTVLDARDRPVSVAVRDVWRRTERLQFDGGVRLDYDSRYGAVPSARGGLRYALNAEGTTALKAGVGRFVGQLPLNVAAFGAYPVRIDRALDPVTGRTLSTQRLVPTVGPLAMPTATAVTAQVEHEVRPGLDALVGVTTRDSTRLAILDVPASGEALAVTSAGSGTYRELQVSGRQVWPNDQQLFMSYVWSSARGELNDFQSILRGFDEPLLQPGGRARLGTDARHRWLTWGTFNLPSRVVISPVLEWRSGFRYSTLDARQRYAGVPNGAQFPSFMALDLVIFRTFEAFEHRADLGIQVFNSTNHANPRDVYPVAGAPQFGTFTNSVGPILRGFMLIKW